MSNVSEEEPASDGAAVKDTPFRCPGCGQPLRVVPIGDDTCCVRCNWRAGDADGFLDFVTDQDRMDEIEYYDAEYADVSIEAGGSVSSLRQLWVDNPLSPHNEALWRRMQDIRGKTVVVLGSGAAARELYFVELEPRWLVLSDLSKVPLRALRDGYLPQRSANVIFAAIDAENLPFSDGSVDVVYGYAFVHHLPDVDRFLAEAARVLRPGGLAVFLDAAYAPIWEGAKQGWLRWLMRVAHRVNPISPEDIRFTLQGGFRLPDLDRRIRAVGGMPWFECSGSLHYLAVRASEILARSRPELSLGRRDWIAQPDRDPPFYLQWRHRRILEAFRRLDVALAARFEIARRNRVRLAWGFEKPVREDAG